MSLLATRSLSIGFRAGHKLLQSDLNLTLEKGQVVSLLGQNGVGKTTLIKTIGGLIPALAGEVIIDGTSTSKLPPGQMAEKLSMVLTEKPAAANMTVVELIALGRYPYASWMGSLSITDKEVIERVMTETKINYLAEKRLNQLSDGQFQKVMIARALAQETDLIILDEPTAHLDLANKVDVMLLLRELAGKGKGIIIVTHDLQISLQMSDNVWLMNFNDEIKSGLPEDLVLNGAIEKALFPSSHNIDLLRGTVKGINGDKGIVQLKGEHSVVEWTKQALTRAGYRLSQQEARVIVECDSGSWVILDSNGQKTSASIGSLLDDLDLVFS